LLNYSGIKGSDDLLLRPAVNNDNAQSCATNGTYSGLFKVVGILLRDHLTKKKCL